MDVLNSAAVRKTVRSAGVEAESVWESGLLGYPFSNKAFPSPPRMKDALVKGAQSPMLREFEYQVCSIFHQTH
jgi:hypothetical protein